MTAGARVLETVRRNAPLGLRVFDVAAAAAWADGLEIDVVGRGSRTRALANRSGIYCAFGIPGLNGFELGGAADAAAWAGALRRYRIEVRDPAGRFLPFAFPADLPAKGLFNWLAPWMSPPQPLVLPTEHGSPPAAMASQVPLFSSSARTFPGTLAQIRAQLREFGTDRPAAWCLLTASIDGLVRGLGLADGEGRVAVLFPYPEPPKPVLTSPPSPINDFRWDAELAAYYLPRPVGLPAPSIPDLADVLAQLAAPCLLLQSTASPPEPLVAQPLEYRVPLTVRTATPDGPSSYLFVNPA
ncbi:hypothetical protein MYXO_01881 [Myxococcaceae bacterium]|nr:hypothetical protein MYXO_01881 [Myxococcaceae bacterium]